MTVIPYKPAGKLIESAFNIIPIYGKARQLFIAMKLIDSVHHDGILPRITVDLIRVSPENYSSIFVYDATTLQAKSIAIWEENPRWIAGMIHEVGHFIDWCAFGNSKRFGSTSPELELIKWLKAVKSSKRYSQLIDIRKRPSKYAGKVSGDSKRIKYIAEYWLEPHELFARCYTQYVLHKSSSNYKTASRLYKQIVSLENLDGYSQWEPSDFTMIEKEMDCLFLNRGWIV